MNRIALGLAFLLLAAAAGLWFWSSFEVVPTTKYTPATAEVSGNPWTAFVRGLPEGFGVEEYSDPEDIDLDGAAWIAASWWWLQDEDPGPWVEWVSRGGRLLVEFEEWDTVEEPWSDLPGFRGLAAREGPPREKEGDEAVRASWSGSAVEITVDPSVAFEPGSGGSVWYEAGGLPVVRIETVGKGWVLASGEPVFLHNRGLMEEGNRRFAAALVEGLDQEYPTFWLPAPSDAPVPVRNAGLGSPVLGLALLVLAALVFWRAGPRLGPVLDRGTTERLSLAERFLAEGWFLWRHRTGQELLGSLPGLPAPPARPSARRFVHDVSLWVRRKSAAKRKDHDD